MNDHFSRSKILIAFVIGLFSLMMFAEQSRPIVTAKPQLLKKVYTLTITVEPGVNGTPAMGLTKYEKGALVKYNYSTASRYSKLVVTLDGMTVARKGTVLMDRDHTLIAKAQKSPVLQVTLPGQGVNGTPLSGMYPYGSGEIINYGYTLASGYSNLVVKLDSVVVPASGTIAMNANHTLNVTVTPPQGYHQLTVECDWACFRITSWNPVQGVYSYPAGTTVPYSYTSNGSSGVQIKINGVIVFKQYGMGVTATGSVIMNSDTVISVAGI